MPSERYFIETDFSDGETLKLEGNEFHHLANVMRTRLGEDVEVVNGKGKLAKAIFKRQIKNVAFLEVTETHFFPPQDHQLILAQAFPKANKLDLIIEKATEIGVSAIWFFPGDKSAKKEIFPNQLERMNAIAVSALKQCGRYYLPAIAFMPALVDWNPWDGRAYFGDVSVEAPLLMKIWNAQSPDKTTLFFVGPESGFSEREQTELHSRGAVGVKLTQYTLRTETAALVGLALIEHLLENKDL